MSDNTINPVDEAVKQEVLSYAKFKAQHGTELEKQTFSNVANFIPSTRSVLPLQTGYVQSPLIGTFLFPTIVASPDGNEAASFPVFGKESFYAGENDVVAVNGSVKSADFAISWTSAVLDAHSMNAPVDVRIEKAMAASGLSAASEAIDLARGQVEARKEKAISDLIRTTGSYSSGSLEDTLSGATQWSHASSTPIPVIYAAIEAVRAACGKRPNTFWLSPKAFQALRTHASILATMQYGGSSAMPAAPASLSALSSLFGMNIVVGDHVHTTTVNGALADTWGDEAGLLVVGNSNLHEPKFGATFSAAGSPKVMPAYFDRAKGVEGSNIYQYVDYYKPVVTMNTAGFLWTDASA